MLCGFLYLHTAQAFSQQHCVELKDTVYILPDSIILIPSSVKLSQFGKNIDSYRIENNNIRLLNGANKPVKLCYNYILRHNQLIAPSIPTLYYDSSTIFTNTPEVVKDQQSTQEFLGINGIKIEGAFLRSVSGGQQSGVYMHSALDLIISGKISDDLRLNATLTDQQLPFEPDGNTQRLQDFDRVNIQLFHKNWTVEGGDINPRAYSHNNFLKYDRRVQGVKVSTPLLTFDSLESNTSILSSLARSKVAVQTILPTEGVLGPYRLQGSQNEPFIFILAGSESVFLEGKILTRGVDADYVIDYNSAEITFNPSIFITKFSQIQVEFEYSDQQFSRSLISMQNQQKIGNLNLSLNYFQEADNVNRPLENLSKEQIETLSKLEPNQSYAFISSADSSIYLEDRAMYIMADTLLGDDSFEYYKISTNPDATNYTISFSLVGEGEGDYIINQNNSNYQTFTWVAPINGISQGNYAPIKKIVLPQKQRMLELGLSYDFESKDQLFLNLAFGERMFNRYNPEYSSLNGKALSMGYRSREIYLAANDKLKLNYNISFEHLDSAFLPVQTFRDLSFNRDWGYSQSAAYIAGEENALSAEVNISVPKHSLSYHWTVRQKLHNKPGQFHQISYKHAGKFNLATNSTYLTNAFQGKSIGWKKFGIDLNYNQWWLVPGYAYNVEEHSINVTDSIMSSFQNYRQHTLYLKKNDSSQWNFQLSHQFRKDFKPFEGKFEIYENAQISHINSAYRYNERSELAIQITRKEIIESNEENFADSYYQGSFSWRSSFFNNILSHSVYYQTGTGRVLERSYFFQEVALGLGSHSWSDLNGNGKKELDEFFLDETTYGDRNYVKLFNFTNDYQTAFVNSFQSSVQMNLPRSWRNTSIFRSVLSRFSAQWSWKLDHKNIHDNWAARINPFSEISESDKLLSAKQFMKSSFYFNRGERWGVNYHLIDARRKQLLLNGFESVNRESHEIELLLNPISDWSMTTSVKNSFHSTNSDILESKNYSYQNQAVLPMIHWQHFKNYRISIGLEYGNKNPLNTEEQDYLVSVKKLDLGQKWNQGLIGMMEAHFQYIQLQSSLENEQSPLAYELYEGLRCGENYVWNVSFRRKIIGDLNLSLNYNGRKSPTTKTRQFGSVQLTAIF